MAAELYDIEAEKNVLSAIMQTRTSAEAQSYVKELDVIDFYHEAHKLIFKAMQDIAAEKGMIDLVTLAAKMKASNTLEKAGGSMKLTDVNAAQIGTSFFKQHTAIIRDLAKKRELKKTAERFVYELTHKDDSAETLQEKAKAALTLLPKEYQAKEAELYRKSYASDFLADFMAAAELGEKNKPIPTGFKSLDEIMDGGAYPGLHVVGAVSSLGKTTFCLQLGDQMAAQGQDVLFISLEMARDEVMAKSISRETLLTDWKKWGRYHNKFAMSTRGVLTGSRWKEYTEQQMEILWGAVEAYNEYAKRVKIIEGVGDVGVNEVRDMIEKHIALTGKKPVVILDYLQILAPLNDKGTDKQNTDKAITELKKISRDYNLVVFVISSFNRESYSAPVSMASYKESGNVEYSADVAIALQYEGMDYMEGENEKDRTKRIRELRKENEGRGKSGDRQRLQLKVLKNRNSPKGDFPIGFFPKYNYFEDMGGKIIQATNSEPEGIWETMEKEV